MNALTHPMLTLEAYLAWENEQPEKHEFHRGEVFAMVGARRAHAEVVMNLGGYLRAALRGSPCSAYAESSKVQVGEDTVLYPDVFITCDKADRGSEMIFRAPKVVVEVLSPTTQRYDRSEKFALYRRISSLREYILVDPDTRRVEAFRINELGQWVLHDMSDGAVFEVAALDLQMPMADVFAGIDPPA